MSPLRLLALVIMKNKPAKKRRQVSVGPICSLFSYAVNGSFSCSITREELEQRWGKGARAAAENAWVETLFKSPGRIYRAGRKILVIIWNEYRIMREKSKICLSSDIFFLFAILTHTTCFKPSFLVDHFFKPSTLHFLGIYVCWGSGHLIKKKKSDSLL